MEDAVKPKELEPWLKEALRAQITTAEKTIQKAKNDIEAQVASLKEVVTDLLRKSEKDSAEKRNDRAVYKAARAAGRMCLELQDLLSAPLSGDPQSYEGLKQFSDSTARAANDAARIRDKWIRYIRPYYILDMMSLNASIDKFRRLGDQTWEIFSKEGGLLRRLEEIHAKIEKIAELEKSLQEQLEERDHVIDEINRLDPQISETEHLIESLAANAKIAGLKKIDSRLEELRAELLASGFRRLGRPLRKLEAMAGRGEYPIAPEVRENLSEYLKRPFMTFVHEQEGYPSLKSVLRNLQQAVERKKLLLKQREERKVLERIDSVAEKNALDGIHREATTLFAERTEYLQDPGCLELVRAYRQKKQDLKNLQSKYGDLQHRSKLLSEKAEALKNSLTEFAKETGLLAEKLAKRPVRIELALDDLSA
ncbi:hypothetical protein [[Eubacterium] cellulosolvens]